MPKSAETVGTGITARAVTTYSGADMQPAFMVFANQWNSALLEGGGEFGARVLMIERECQQVLAGANPTAPRQADNAASYATRILRLIDMVKRAIECGHGDSAARLAVDVGCLYMEAHMKGFWEAYALRGQSNASQLNASAKRANSKRAKDAKARYEQWQALADDIDAASKVRLSRLDVATLIAEQIGGNADTIRRKIARRK
jgi:hypothetical protein